MRRLIFLPVLIWALTWPAQAQPTPQPEQRFILGWSSEVIFPAAIRFILTLSRPASELASAELTIVPVAGQLVSVTLDPEDDALKTEPFTEIVYLWPLPSDSPPSLFSEIEITWQAVSSRDEVARIQDTFTFTDARAEWLLDEPLANGLTVVMPVSGTAALKTEEVSVLRRSLSPVAERLAADRGRPFQFRAILYPAPLGSGCERGEDGRSVAIGPLSQTEVPCSADMAPAIISRSRYDLVESRSSSGGPVLAAMTDYLVHRVYADVWQGHDVPAWFSEGMVSLYAPNRNRTAGQILEDAARTSSLFSLDDMASPPSATGNTSLWQAQSVGMILYLADQLGLDGLIRLAGGLQPEIRFADSVESATGQSLSALIPALSRWIFTPAGQGAFGLNLYAPPTLTATLTRTPTATLTATASLTPMASFTATVTGELSPTPRPSHTPTRVPSLAPATRTPRPAGSLNTPQPTPAPPATSINDPSVATVVLVIGLAIIGLAALIFTLVRRPT